MDWIRGWILQISAIIVISSICDIAMPDGDIKKYVKPVLGFVLIFALIRPVTAFRPDKIRLDILEESRQSVLEITNNAEATEKKTISALYEKRLAERMTEEIKNNFELEAGVYVKTDTSEAAFGEVLSARITLYTNNGEVVNTETIRNKLCGDFGLKKDTVSIVLSVK